MTPQADDNLCLFRCIVRNFRPEESEDDREMRVILMLRIFKASQFLNVKSDSVILDHRQVIIQDDLDYLVNIVDNTDLLNENLPADNQWATTEVQQAIHEMCGVTLEDLKKIELFDLHIDVFGLREINDKIRKQRTCGIVVRLSDSPSDRSVNILLETDETGAAGHYYLVTNPKELLKKLVCPHCSAVICKLQNYKTHMSKCEEGRARHIYPGGFHKQPLGIREKLQSVGIKMPEDLSYYKEFICYDFEAMFKNISVKTQKTEYLRQHCPVSYVICEFG